MARSKKSADSKTENIDPAEIKDAVAEDVSTTDDPISDDSPHEQTEPQAASDTVEVPEPETEQPEPETPKADEEVTADEVEPVATAAVEEEPAPETAEEAPVTETVVAPQPVKRGSVVPGLIGGILAAVIGYGAAQFIKPSGWPFPGSVDGAAIDSRLTQLSDQVSSLQTAITERDDRIAGLQSALEDAKAQPDVTPQLDALSGDISAFEDRLTAVESRPVAEAVVSPEATAAYERQLTDMRETLEAEVARLKEAQASASAEQAEANAASAVAQLRTAIDEGRPFADILGQVDVAAPPDLASLADEGVPTLAALQDRFPAAARNALAASVEATAADDTTGKVQGFLRKQLGLRSLAPKEGSDPDAILSRAEAALRDGDIAATLDEIGTLPEAGQAEMATWVDDAQSRLSALDALSQMLDENK